MDTHGARVNIVRVGQLCGDEVKGGWKETEWVPLVVRSAQISGEMPYMNKVTFLVVCTPIEF